MLACYSFVEEECMSQVVVGEHSFSSVLPRSRGAHCFPNLFTNFCSFYVARKGEYAMITPRCPDQEQSPSLRGQMKKRILLVDSEEGYRLIMASLLGEEGQRVSTCADALAAIGLIERERFDFAIVEHSTPLLDGLGLLEEIRKRDLRIRVLLVAAQYEIEPYLVAMNLGALDFFCKPLDYGEIQRLIQTYG